MYIGILVPFLNTFGKKGYYHSQEIGLAKCLSKYDHQVVVYKCFKGIDASYEETIDNVKIKYINVKGIGTHAVINRNIFSNEIDVLFTFSDTQLFIPLIERWCKKNNIIFIPYVGTFQSVSEDQPLKKSIMDFIFKHNTIRTYRREFVFAKTKSIQNHLYNLGVRKSIIVPVGLDFDLLKTDLKSLDRFEVRRGLGFSDNEKIILYVGRMVPEKRPIDMVKIFQRIFKENKNYRLIMIGNGIMYKEIEKIIYDNKLDKDIILIKQVAYDQIWKYHYLADYFVNLWDKEIFGMAVMESVFYKTCTIAIDAPGPDTILCGMKAHAICKNDEEVINELLNKKVDEQLLEEAKQKLISEFSWDRCVRQIEFQYSNR